MLRTPLFLSLAVVGCSLSAPTNHMAPAANAVGDLPLVGTWRAVRYETWDRSGQVSSPFGDPVSGYAVFDPTGHAFVHLMRMPPVPPFASASEPTTEELRNAFTSYAGYYGRYTVDVAASTVTIAVEGSSLPSYTGSSQVRPFRIEGDTLRLGIPREYQATLVRVQ